MTTKLAQITQAFAESFETRKRDNGESFICLKDGSPEWMTDLCREAHEGMLPDDWRYEMISRVASELAEIDPETWKDEQGERVDSLVDIWDNRLTAWLASHHERIGYCEEARKEFGEWPDSLPGLLQRGQYKEIDEIWGALTRGLQQEAEAVETE